MVFVKNQNNLTMRTIQSFQILMIGLLVFSSCQKTAKSDEKEAVEEWISLFNGENLDDWNVKIKGYELDDNFNNTFRVVDGMMQVNYDQYDTFNESYGHIFYKQPYSNYRLRLQYRFIGDQVEGGEGWAEKNSGVMIHSPAPERMELDQGFPISLEVQLLGGVKENEERPTGNLCTPGAHVVMDGQLITDHCITSSAKTYYDEQWVDLEILVLSDSLISHIINGQEVISYSKPIIGGQFNNQPEMEGEKLTGGYISLQSESHPIEFKNIELLELEE